MSEQAAVQTQPPKVDELPPFKVLLHNDDVNDMGHVVQSLIDIFTMDATLAAVLTVEAHRTGLALVKTCHKELAELKREQLQSKGLTSTIEPA